MVYAEALLLTPAIFLNKYVFLDCSDLFMQHFETDFSLFAKVNQMSPISLIFFEIYFSNVPCNTDHINILL